MIDYRCWYCNKRYMVDDARRGERRVCTCGKLVKVPRRSGGRSKVWSTKDFVIESLVYGGGGAVLGFGLALMIAPRVPWLAHRTARIVVALTVGGFLLGAIGREWGINLIGQKIREREQA